MTVITEACARMHQSKFGWRPIHVAAFEGHLEMIKLLVEHGNATVDAKAKTGATPLDFAKNKQFNNIVEYLELKMDD